MYHFVLNRARDEIVMCLEQSVSDVCGPMYEEDLIKYNDTVNKLCKKEGQYTWYMYM